MYALDQVWMHRIRIREDHVTRLDSEIVRIALCHSLQDLLGLLVGLANTPIQLSETETTSLDEGSSELVSKPLVTNVPLVHAVIEQQEYEWVQRSESHSRTRA